MLGHMFIAYLFKSDFYTIMQKVILMQNKLNELNE